MLAFYGLTSPVLVPPWQSPGFPMNTVQPSTQSNIKPTIVLVHGAYADGSSWSGVIERLQQQGYTALAPALPLRGPVIDTPYIASIFNQISGPVLAVGHSYAGAVISAAATQAPNVVGLVFVCAFAPDDGVPLVQIAGTSKDSILGTALMQYQYPTGPGTETAVEFLVNPALFPTVFAGDLPPEQAAVLAAVQRPVAAAAFAEPFGAPAWKTLPCWAVVATGDKAAGADVTRATAQQIGATLVEVEGSHLILISQPQAVAKVILQAAQSVA